MPKALAAWRHFCEEVDDIEALDDGYYRLFPLVAGNLQNCGESIPHQGRILGVLRYAWAKNQKLLGEIAPLLQALQDAGIKILLLKGAALIELYRQQGSVRSMVDVDILIHPADLEKTIELLQGQGCTANVLLTPEYLWELLQFRHELTLRTPAAMELDIHWYLVADARHPQAENYFWRDAIPYKLAGLSSQTLNITDQLLHTCLHGVQWNEVSPVRWLSDAVMLIRAGIDWGRLEIQARRLERLECVRETLLFLDKLEITLPPGVVEHWRQMEITPFEKMEGGFRTRRPNSRERTKQLAWIYLRLHRGQSLPELLRTLPAYMKQLHHFRAYSRCLTFLIYVLYSYLNKSDLLPERSRK